MHEVRDEALRLPGGRLDVGTAAVLLQVDLQAVNEDAEGCGAQRAPLVNTGAQRLATTSLQGSSSSLR